MWEKNSGLTLRVARIRTASGKNRRRGKRKEDHKSSPEEKSEGKKRGKVEVSGGLSLIEMPPNWALDSRIASTSASEVVLVADNARSGCLYAIKRVKTPAREAFFLQRLSNEHVVRTVAIYVSPEHTYFQQVSYDCPLDFSSFKYAPAKPRTSDDVATIDSNVDRNLRQMLAGLTYVHQQDVLHRDIKPANFFLKGDRVVLADFDCSYLLTHDRSKDEAHIFNAKKIIGTPMFLAPELLDDKFRFKPGFFKRYSSKVLFKLDVFSLGCTLFYLIYEKYPFVADSYYSVQHKITHDDIVFPATKITHKIVPLLDDMLNKFNEKRLSLTDVVNKCDYKIESNHKFSGVPVVEKLDHDLDLLDLFDQQPLKFSNDKTNQYKFKLPLMNESNSSISSNKSSLKHSKLVDFKKFNNSGSGGSAKLETIDQYFDQLDE